MGISPLALTSSARSQDFAAAPVLVFMAKNQTALWQAARLIGGYAAARLVDRCAEHLEYEGHISNCVRLMLDQLICLLTFEPTNSVDGHRMGYFAVISPDDPVIEEIATLRDGLRRALEEFEARRTWAKSSSRVRTA